MPLPSAAARPARGPAPRSTRRACLRAAGRAPAGSSAGPWRVLPTVALLSRAVRSDSLAPVFHRLVDDGQQVARLLRRPDEAVRFLFGRGELGGRRLIEERQDRRLGRARPTLLAQPG